MSPLRWLTRADKPPLEWSVARRCVVGACCMLALVTFFAVAAATFVHNTKNDIPQTGLIVFGSGFFLVAVGLLIAAEWHREQANAAAAENREERIKKMEKELFDA